MFYNRNTQGNRKGGVAVDQDTELLELFQQLTEEEKVRYLAYLRCLAASQSGAASAQE